MRAGGDEASACAAGLAQFSRALTTLPRGRGNRFAPDQRGRTVDPWKAHFDAWPVPFGSLDEVRAYFGSLGDYFADCFEERADGYHLIAELPTLYEIASEWGRRDYWSIVDSIKCPLLVIEGEHTLMPPGQQAEVAARAADGRHLVVAGAGHYPTEPALAAALPGLLSRFLDRVREQVAGGRGPAPLGKS